jgi:hypothetical protein
VNRIPVTDSQNISGYLFGALAVLFLVRSVFFVFPVFAAGWFMSLGKASLPVLDMKMQQLFGRSNEIFRAIGCIHPREYAPRSFDIDI